MIRLFAWVILFLPMWQANASGGAMSSTPEVTQVYEAAICRGLDRAPAVQTLPATQAQAFLDRQPRPPELEIGSTERGFILINMGEQGTAGYRVRLSGELSHVQQGRLRLPVIWETPQAGMMLAQMITHPCLLVSVKAQFTQVDIVDQHGRVVLTSSGH